MSGSPGRDASRRRMPDFGRPEIRVTALLGAYNFLVMCSFSIIKPARNALLLDRLGPSWLPVGVMGAAVATTAVVYGAHRLRRCVSEHNRVSATTLVLFLNLLFFRWLFDEGGNWVALAFYIWSSLFSNILTTQFWLVAGDQFTPREGKKLLGWVGCGGIVGAIAGPGLAFYGVGWAGTENLMYVSAVLLAGCIPLVRTLEGRVRADHAAAAGPAEPDKTGVGLLREFRHLKLIALISGVSLIVQTVLDFQFQTIASAAFETENEKTAFFAQFFAVQNVAGLLFQLLITRYVLMRFGVVVALSLLPAALMLGSAGVLMVPTLLVASLARMGEGGIRYSIQEATREILWMPLPSGVRSRARPLIDIFGARLFEGMGGLVILISTGVFHLSVASLSGISIALIGVWGIAVLAVKQGYVEALREHFSELPAQPQHRAAEVLDPGTVALLLERLDSPDEVQVCQTLALLDLMHDKSGLVPHLKRIAKHPAESVCAEVLRMLRQEEEGGFVAEAERLLKARDPSARLEGVRYFGRFAPGARRAELSGFFKDPDPRVRTAAVVGVGMDRADARRVLEGLCREQSSDETRCEAALALGTLNRPEYDDLLLRLLCDPSIFVVRAAMETAARTRRRVFVPMIVPYLAHETLMLYAQRALRAYGDHILGTLRDYMDDADEPECLRRTIPGCLAAISTPRSAQMLVELLEAHQRVFGEPIVEALGEMRCRMPGLCFDADRVEAAILSEVRVRDDGSGRGDADLALTLGLLGLIYPVEDIHRAHLGLLSRQKTLRSNALELLDNLIRPDLKRAILPSIEALTSPDERG